MTNGSVLMTKSTNLLSSLRMENHYITGYHN